VADGLNDYERQVETEIEKWRSKPPGPFAKTLGVIEKPLTKPIGWVLEKTALDRVVKGALELVMDAGSWTVDEDRILARYRELRVDVASIDDIRTQVSLKDMDRHAVGLAKGYRWSAAGEGVAAGGGAALAAAKKKPGAAAGLIAADVAALTTMACRAAAHYAAVYGYRVDAPIDRTIALKILSGATSSDLAAKEAMFNELNAIALLVAKKTTWDELRQRGLVKGLEQAAAQFSIRLTQKKLAQAVTVVGLALGGGYNSWYLSRVSEWGYYSYRDRLLVEKQATSGARRNEPTDADDLPDADVVDGADDEPRGSPSNDTGDELPNA